MKIDRAEVERLLDYAASTKDGGTNIIKPRSLEALCRLTLEVMDAPTVKVRGKVGEVCMVPVSHDFCGSRVRLVRVGEG